jgi:hypothetical protein
MSETEKFERLCLLLGVTLLGYAITVLVWRTPMLADVREAIRGGLALIILSLSLRLRW